MRVLLSILALLVLVVAGLAGFWWLGAPEAHRWVAHRALERVLGRDVHVDGALEVELGAEPVVQLTGLRIDSPPWAEAPTQLQIERARIQIALRPLLRRALVFPLVALEGVAIALETDADGRHSWHSDGAQAGASTSSPIPLFDRLSVKDATVIYRDQRDGRRTELHLVSLTHQPDDASGDRRLDAHGDIDGKAFRIMGTSGSLETAWAATDPYPLDLQIQLPSVEARLAGTIADVARATGLDLRLGARSPSLLAATEAWGVSVPADAEITVDARLIGDLATLSLADVRAEISSNGGRLEFAGGLRHVWEGTGLDGRVELTLDPTGQLSELFPVGWRSLQQIEATASVAGSVVEVAFNDLSARIRGPGDMTVDLAGNLRVTTPGDVSLQSFDLASRLEVTRVADLADLFDLDGAGLGRLWFEGRLSGGDRHFDADGRAMLGETPFDGILSGDFSASRPSFKGRLHSPRVRLVDLGLTPKASGDPPPAAQATIAAERYLFGREAFPLDRLEKFDLDLEVQLDSLEGIALAIDRAHAHVMLMEGRLHLSEVQFYVVDGYAEASAEVDVRAPTPTWRIQVEMDDVELGDIWRQLETDVPLSGELDLVLDLEAIGRSPRDLASSAAGDLSLALQRGQIRSRLFDLTAMNPIRWLVARSTRRGYADINCFVARFQAEQGVADLLALVLDTPNVVATGEGRIDFARETIDVRIRPSAKRSRVVELATPFAVRGSLANPLVETSATGATARALGRVALGPVNLLGTLLPLVSDRGRDQDNPCLTFSDPETGRP